MQIMRALLGVVLLVLCMFAAFLAIGVFATGSSVGGVVVLIIAALLCWGGVRNIRRAIADDNKNKPAAPTSAGSNQPQPVQVYNTTETVVYIQRNSLPQFTAEEKAAKAAEFAALCDAVPLASVTATPGSAKKRGAFGTPELNFAKITARTSVDRLFPLVVIDTETTGFNAKTDDIIEVAAVKFGKGWKPLEAYTTLCKSRNAIPASSYEVHHISDDMVEGAPAFADIAEDFSEFIKGCNIVGHNLSFDFRFLYEKGVDFAENVRYFDTLDIARKVLNGKKSRYNEQRVEGNTTYIVYDVENHKLDTLAEYYGIIRDDSHRSLSDCMATAVIFRKLVEAKTGAAD